MANPIQLLIQLQSDRAKGNSNVAQHVQELKKYYERNPLLVTIGINKGRLDNEIRELNKSLSNRKIELDVSLKNSSNAGLGNIEKQIDSIINKVKELNGRLGTLGNGQLGGRNSSLSSSVAEIERLSTANRQSTTTATQLQGELGRLSTSINGVAENTRRVQRETDSLGTSLTKALPKFAVWILAANAIYAPIRGVQDLTKQVIELDSAMVELARVELQPLTIAML